MGRDDYHPWLIYVQLIPGIINSQVILGLFMSQFLFVSSMTNHIEDLLREPQRFPRPLVVYCQMLGPGWTHMYIRQHGELTTEMFVLGG